MKLLLASGKRTGTGNSPGEKMALWRGILAFLPVGLLTKRLSKEVLDELAPARVQLINGLSPKAYQEATQDFPADFPLWLRYLAFTTWQGELSEYAPLFMRTGALRARALKLRDPAAFFRFADIDNDETDFDEFTEALISGDPAIQATAMVWTHHQSISDPVSVPQTPGLRTAMLELAKERKFDRQFPAFSSRATDDSVGGLQLLSLEDINRAMGTSHWAMTEWLKTAASKSPDGQVGVSLVPMRATFRHINFQGDFETFLASIGVTDLLLNNSGNFPEYLRAGLEYIQPKVVRKLLQTNPSRYSIIVRPSEMYVSRDLAQRAWEMLELLANSNISTGEDYLILLRIMCGGPTQAAVLSPQMIRTMAIVAHPELPDPLPNISFAGGLYLSESAMHYDLDRLLGAIAGNANELSRTDIAIIYSYGKLTQNPIVLRQAIADLRRGWTDQLNNEQLTTAHTVELLELLQKYGQLVPKNYVAFGPIEAPAMRQFYGQYQTDLSRFDGMLTEANEKMQRWRKYYGLLRA